MTSVLLIGGGLAGCTAALALLERGVENVRVLEAGARPGGVVGTHLVDGFRFESGPNTIAAGARAFRELAATLGLADRLIPSLPQAKRRWLFFRGRLVAAPLGPGALARTPLLSPRAKLRLLSEPLRRRRPEPGVERGDEPEPSLEALLTERLGREPTRTLAGAFVRGVYAGEIEQLGAWSAFPRLWSAVQEHGGVVRGLFARRRTARALPPPPGPLVSPGRLLSLPEGLGELAPAFERALGARLVTGARVEALERRGARWHATTADGREAEGETLVLATSAAVAARLLGDAAPAEVAANLTSIRHVNVTIQHLGFERAAFARPLDGFGFLVPPDEAPAPAVLGTLFPSNLFPGRAPADALSFSSIYRSEDLPSSDRLQQALDDLAQALGLARLPAPRTTHTVEWNDVIPQYTIGHALRMQRARAALAAAVPNVELIGAYLDGIAVDDVVRSGRAAAARIVARLERDGGGA